MPSYRRTACLLPARIVLLGATTAIVAVLVGTAAATAAPAISAPKITVALQPGQTASEVAPGNGSAWAGGLTSWTPAFGPTSAPQPGQTGWSAARAGAVPTVSAPMITVALQPGQTVSAVTPGNGGDPVYGATGTPALGPASAPQPGQTGW
jgi:hypothetical protein